MTCNTSVLTFDISATAGMYSQLTGVLAGFAFVAITLVLAGDHRRKGEEVAGDVRETTTDVHVLLALVAAFLGLIIATLEYAVLAGERACGLMLGRAASEEFLGGIIFAFAVFVLLYAVVQMVAHSGLPRIGEHVRVIVTLFGPPLAILFLAVAAQDVANTPWLSVGLSTVQPQHTQFADVIEWLALPLPVVMLLMCSAIMLVGWRWRMRKHRFRRSRLPHEHDFGRIAFPYMSLVLVIGPAVRSAMLSSLDASAHISHWEVVIWLSTCFVWLLVQTALLSFARDLDGGVKSRAHTKRRQVS
jgi:hypothetical protein